MTWAVKWGGDSSIMSDNVFSSPTYSAEPENDYGVVSTIHKLLDETDIVVFHNGDRYDIKRLNTRFIFHGLHQPSPYKSIDTLKVARRKFAFPSNKLTAIGKYLGLGEKMETGGFKL